jgi:hypothetical protein
VSPDGILSSRFVLAFCIPAVRFHRGNSIRLGELFGVTRKYLSASLWIFFSTRARQSQCMQHLTGITREIASPPDPDIPLKLRREGARTA